ncbi:MAG: MBL fold metallo-hydrolase [Gammaproteobacteria bacterium]|nr:MBL fold metallo-hydrolase [Gammaproteobacteria bacterium]
MWRVSFKTLLAVLLCSFLFACERSPTPADAGVVDEAGFTAPSAITVGKHQQSQRALSAASQTEFMDASRGLLASPENLQVRNAQGEIIWDQPGYRFIKGQAPASVNPSLWRRAQLNNIHGLFEVVPGIYQMRGFDLANLSIIEGQSGLIVVDPLTTRETAAAAWQFFREQTGNTKPVLAIIFTHSHIDHFGGVFGVIQEQQARNGDIQVIAPKGFIKEAVSENVLLGVAMQRRAGLMYGQRLPRSARGHVDTGLGKEPAISGDVGILRPTHIIDHTPQRLMIDGMEFIFQHAPESEAPAELTFYLPALKAYCGAELVSQTLHNVYTPRGAKVRDALKWSRYIEEARQTFAEARVYFASHHWPIWGRERIDQFLRSQRDTYKYIHDQSVRMINRGFTAREIAESIALPEALQEVFSSRGYYGTVKHNSKAVYQAYMGWFDAVASNLDPLPPQQAGQGYVALAGGAKALFETARQAFDDGNYRWSAELLTHLEFSGEGNDAASELLAASYDQLGYQAESGPWRDFYLSSAFELRHGKPRKANSIAAAEQMLAEVPLELFYDALAVRILPDKVAGKRTAIGIRLTDLDAAHLLYLENSVLHHRPLQASDKTDAVLNITHAAFLKMMTGNLGLKGMLASDAVKIEGSRVRLMAFFAGLDKPAGDFAIVRP